MSPHRGWLIDSCLYAGSALFALATEVFSTLTPHRIWGSVAVWGYLAATVATLIALIAGPTRIDAARGAVLRLVLTGWTIGTTLLLPLLVQAQQRATGVTGRAQEEVPVIESAGRRLLELGTPYLDRDAIAALPEPGRLVAYLPYQPAMALLGIPRALHPTSWWTDARVVFLLVSAAAIGAALVVLRLRPTHPAALRAMQSVTVLPLCALTLGTGGDDLPVLALCLLALALCATGHPGVGGIIVGLAGSLKLIALPVAVVLGIYVLARRRPTIIRYAVGAFGLPLLTVVPALLLDIDSVVENVLRFPLGHALVRSPAASPLPGYLLATHVPGGRALALGLLGAATVAIGWWLVRRPPRTAAQAAVVGAIGLTVAICLLPATRFGYLMYPVAFLAWYPALRTGGGDG